MAEKLVSLLVINWNGEKHLGELLESLQNQTYKNTEIIVWDNVSNDKSALIAEKFKKAKFIASKENFGYSGGTNRAIDAAKGDYFFVLNNDLVLDKNCVEECVKTMESEENCGIVFPKELYYGKFPEKYEIEFLPKTTFQGNTVKKRIYGKETNFVLGAAFLISKKTLAELKYCFDPRFFMYFEDTDLSFRAIAKGYRILFEKKAVFWHKTAASVPKTRLYYLFRNCLLCYYKNFGFRGFLKFFPILLLKDFLTVSVDLKFSKNSPKDFIKAYFDLFKMAGKFGGEKFSGTEAKRVLDKMEGTAGDDCSGVKCFFKKFYSTAFRIYIKIVFLAI